MGDDGEERGERRGDDIPNPSRLVVHVRTSILGLVHPPHVEKRSGMVRKSRDGEGKGGRLGRLGETLHPSR